MTYAAVAIQMAARSVAAGAMREAQRTAMLSHLVEVTAQIAGAKAFIEQYGGSPLRLAVLPEYLFTSYPVRIGIAEFAEAAAWDMHGPEYDALGKAAQDLNLFLAGNAYERDPNFPGLYFQTCFIIAPTGELILRYRRLNSMFAPTPHDVWSKYLDIYGLEGVFPVARTEIGNLAAIASEEIVYPEIARAMALRGAEIFVHNSSEIGGPHRTHKMVAKQARAFENLAYVVSANTAGIDGYASADGNSMLVDWKGQVLAESGAGETYTAFGDIDLHALRAARRKPGMTNYLSRQRTEIFAAAYGEATVHAADGLIDGDTVRIPDRAHFVQTQQAIITRLAKDGLI